MTLFLVKTISITLALFLSTKILKVKASIFWFFATASFVIFLLNIFSGPSAIVVCLAAFIAFTKMNIQEDIKMTLAVLIVAAILHIGIAYAYVSFGREMIFGKKPVLVAEVVTTEDGVAQGTPGATVVKENIDPKTLKEVYEVMFKSNTQFATFLNGWIDTNSRSNKM